MIGTQPVQLESILYLLIPVVMVIGYLILLCWGFTQHQFDHLGCSKYAVFKSDFLPSPEEKGPDPPLYCQLSYLERKPWWKTGWVWIVLTIWASWLGILLGAFIIHSPR